MSKEKENLRRLPEGQTNGNAGRFQKGITRNVSQKDDRRVLVGLKVCDVDNFVPFMLVFENYLLMIKSASL